jgi:hypothetical protein
MACNVFPRAAAGHLVDSALASGEPWRLSYPIFYLYRHALELYLKAALPQSGPVHDLRPLVGQFEELLRSRVGVGIAADVRDDLLTFTVIDPHAQGFRYTDTTRGDRRMLPGEHWVSLRDLQRLMEVVFLGVEEALRRPREASG